MYRIQLKDFEGPLDLLLFLIRRDELDIFDIPIAAITHEYLEYVRVLEDIDLDGAADFIYMAALLIGIKARMLLPRPETDDENEVLDPRQELVERLLEYRRYKEAAEKLGTLSEERSMLFTRGKASAPQFEAVPPEKLVNTSIYDLIGALRRVLTEAEEEPELQISAANYTIEQQRNFVLRSLAARPEQAFSLLVAGRAKRFIISTFLAILEMAQQGLVGLALSETADDFSVKRL